MSQEFEKYTPQDHQMWQRLYHRQMEVLHNRAASGFMDGLQALQMGPEGIPHYGQLSDRLEQVTGWRLQGVTGIVPNDVFFRLLARRQFPVTTWIRQPAQMDYLMEPDLFHDVFGHVPLLADTAYASFLEALGQLALPYMDNPLAIELLSRIYWFSVEFGLIAEDNALRIYGAGILSSPGESVFCLSPQVPRFYFNLQELFHTPYINHRMQDRYFVIESYDELYACTTRLPGLLDKELKLAQGFAHELLSYGLVIPRELLPRPVAADRE
ncbi:MAG: phenylalanine 4-monooxygenase [Bacteroidetes bacterium]|nr:phenylalanine 4-monooxygenase [Bacteroidota bacterium]